MFGRPNVKKLLAKADVGGLDRAIGWATNFNRPNVKREATEALLSLVPTIQARGDVAALDLAAGSHSPDVQRAAADALIALRRPEAWETIAGRIANGPVAAAMRSAVSDPAAIAHFQRIAVGEVVLPWSIAVEDPRPGLVTDVLLETEAELDSAFLVRLIGESDPERRQRAAAALARIDDPGTFALLIEMTIEQADSRMLAPAAAAAETMGPSAAASLDPDLRNRARDYLAEFLRTKTDPLEPAANLLRMLAPEVVETLIEEVRRGAPEIRFRVNLAGALLSDEEREDILREEEGKEAAEHGRELGRMKDTVTLANELRRGLVTADEGLIKRALADLNRRSTLGDESARDEFLTTSPAVLQLFAWGSVYSLLVLDVVGIEERWRTEGGISSDSTCRICGTGLGIVSGKSVPSAELQTLVADGYDPIRTGRAGPIWQQTLRYPSLVSTSFGLCAACETDVATFAARKERVGEILGRGGTAAGGADVPISLASVPRHVGSLLRFELIAPASGGGTAGYELTGDGLLYADAMLGDRDCPDHPDVTADLDAVSQGRMMMLGVQELAALAAIALGGPFTDHLTACAKRLGLERWTNGALMRIAASIAHATRHSGPEWTRVSGLAERELDATGRAIFDRQLAAGTPTEDLSRLVREALDTFAPPG